MSYIALKHLHVTFVVLSGLGFCLRGFWMLSASPMLRTRWVRVAPHVVDTGLLASALAMVFVGERYPFVEPWLTAKIAGLLAYILFGTVALKRGRTPGIRLIFLVLALATFGYIVAVALAKSPLPY